MPGLADARVYISPAAAQALVCYSMGRPGSPDPKTCTSAAAGRPGAAQARLQKRASEPVSFRLAGSMPAHRQYASSVRAAPRPHRSWIGMPSGRGPRPSRNLTLASERVCRPVVG